MGHAFAPQTLSRLIADGAKRHGDRPALVEGGEALSFVALFRLSEGLAAGLAGEGIGRGDRVAIWLPNSSWWLVGLFAAARLGAVCVCVNTRFRAADLADILSRSGAKALIYAPHFAGMDFQAVLSAVDPSVLARLGLAIACGEGGGPEAANPRTVRIEDLARTAGRAAASPAAEDGIVLFTTSGTTSRPKFVLHDQRSLAIHASDVAAGFQYDRPGSVLLQALPLCGTFGLAQALAALAAGAPSVLLPVFDADAARALIGEHSVTGFNGADEMFKRILDGVGSGALASLDWCGFACFAEPRPVDFARAAERAGLKLVGLYGMSEVQALFARQPEHLPVEQRALAGGLTTSAAASFRIGDPETGGDLADCVSGELYVRGPSLFHEYFGDADATAHAIGADGFVRTGDLAHRTEDGRFVFETRMGDSLRLGGYLVNPAEIDAWLEQDPAIAASQTVAAEMEGRLRPVSFVIAAPGKTPDEQSLITRCRDALARFKVPARVVTLVEFPTTDGPNGRKIQRGRLRDMARDLVG